MSRTITLDSHGDMIGIDDMAMCSKCISDKYCPYKTDTGYCGHLGNWCYLELGDGCNSETAKVPNTPTYRITQLVDISPESIEEIANAVVEKLRKEVFYMLHEKLKKEAEE